MTTPMTPQTDEQWSQMLQQTERVRLAEIEAETERQTRKADIEARERRERRELIPKILVGAVVVLFVAAFFAVMVKFIDDDADENMRMNQMCTQQGRSYDVGDKICYPAGELPKNLR